MRAELREALARVARRVRLAHLLSRLALCWLAWAMIGLLLWYVGPPSFEVTLTLAAFAALSGLAVVAMSQRFARDPRAVARRIEATHPDLGAALLAAVEEDMTTRVGRLGFLQAAVIERAVSHARSHNWNESVPSKTIAGLQAAHATSLCGLAGILLALGLQTRSEAARVDRTIPEIPTAKVEVIPGDTEIEKNSPLLVVARFHGNVPPEAHLIVEGAPDATTPRPMTRSLEDPTFAGRVESVTNDLSYRVAFGDQATPTYHVRVYETPELVRTDVTLAYPDYTGLETKTIEDVRHVTAVEGTELTVLCRLNKEVVSAKLIDENNQEVSLAPVSPGEPVYSTKWTLADSHRYKLQLEDRDGRRNKLTANLSVNVTKNQPPKIAMSQPGHDVRVSPVEELRLKAQMSDDFGLLRYGVNYSIAGQEPKEIVLGTDGMPTAKKALLDQLIDFEAIHAEPDQLISYFVWAEDSGPVGQSRRTESDIYFAEVRHFEEIFRQGEQPPSGSAQEMEGQQGNAQQAEQLAELQKELINATWKMIRRETGAIPTDKLVSDAKLLQETQETVIKQAQEFEEKLQDNTSRLNLGAAVGFMTEAAKRLGEVAQSNTTTALKPAMASEQAAYQALLKLRAREFEVIRSNSRQQSQGRSSSRSAAQRQLNQLELKDDENRFEEQSRANKEQLTKKEQEQRETRQIVSRLRELAQRQADLNERVKELQSALEAAKDEPAKEEIERQLKRLREQQQQILRDTDELQERMENEENRDRMADAREQVEQGREHVRQASEALEKGQLPQALTEGTRANRQLDEVREDLRKQASGQFNEEMTEMRDQARQLDEKQQKLTEQLDAWKNQSRQSLRDTDDRKQVKEDLEHQQTALQDLLERMKKTVGEAEESEPLLAKNLYNTVRKAEEQAIPNDLEETRRMAEAGIAEESLESSKRAGAGLDELRQGVERAARSVLGDETAALKRARDEIQELSRQLSEEIAQHNPDRGKPAGSGNQRPGQPGTGSEVDPFDRMLSANNANERRTPEDAANREPEESDSRDGQPGEPRQGRQPGERGQERQRGQGQQDQQDQDGQPNGQDQAQGEQGRQQQDGQAQGEGEGQEQEGQQGREGQENGQRRALGQRRGQQQAQQGQGQEQGERGEQGGGEGRQGQQAQEGEGQGQGQEGGQEQAGGGSRAGGQPDERRARSLRDDANEPQDGQDGQNGQALGGMLNPGGQRTEGPGNPIMGEGFRQWSDRMRDVEELLDDPALRAEAARVRDRVRGVREEFKRHAKEPVWKDVETMVANPIEELHRKIAEEIRRREAPDALVPIDRDPVPPQYAEGVRRYYERLGSGR